MEREAMGLRIPCFREFSDDIEYIKSIFKTEIDIKRFCEYCGNSAKDVLEMIHNEATKYAPEYKIKDIWKGDNKVTIEVSAGKMDFTYEIRIVP